ncbi:hypothetical protein ACTXT7_012310 [Hymenolepis weldensis]
MMGDIIWKSQLPTCDAAEDTFINQVSFRITSNVGEHSVLGFSKIQSGDVICTGLIRMKNARVDEYDILKKILPRKIAGLERRLNCRTEFYGKAFKMLAQIVFMFEIEGSDYGDVLKHSNFQPNCITERLVSTDRSLKKHL